MNILSLCDYTGNMVTPWALGGHSCVIVDIKHAAGFHAAGTFAKVGCQVGRYNPHPIPDIVFAFPPCTHLAGSGARWWKGKGLRKLSEAISIVADCVDICNRLNVPYMIENPIGALATHWRKPDYYFDPCDYAGYLEDPSEDAYTKRTCLWTGNGFVMPEPKRVDPVDGSKMHRLPPSKDRSALRSRTPRGFAQAVFEANR